MNGVKTGRSAGRIISRSAARVTMSTAWPYSGRWVPSRMPGSSLNWRRTSTTTALPARPTDSISSAPNRYGRAAPMSRPISTLGFDRSNTRSAAGSSRKNEANSTSAAGPAEPIA